MCRCMYSVHNSLEDFMIVFIQLHHIFSLQYTHRVHTQSMSPTCTCICKCMLDVSSYPELVRAVNRTPLQPATLHLSYILIPGTACTCTISFPTEMGFQPVSYLRGHITTHIHYTPFQTEPLIICNSDGVTIATLGPVDWH